MSRMSWAQKFHQLTLTVKERGFLGSFRSLYYYSLIRHGKFIGTDTFGNKYYENDDYSIPRNRWVEYSDYKTCDPTTVEASWFPWLHNQVYHPPTHPEVQKLVPFWLAKHKPNMTGTEQAYFPPGHFYNQDRDTTTKEQKYVAADPNALPEEPQIEEKLAPKKEKEAVHIHV
mmetsp:Transcript_21736/g.29875  ORF Transcript_21736/g.29875 Transcript_21736/m.29875 type:complete len:172 (+) Transcript_21736:37-552(+)|eukprot:CAMPEP_0201483324 /NCGR_PEP_ID=MMETSP0151_2-20130828/7542_1 /ASSEMBLY_ACC=CAM_ASM_000257 /TAXON_ID=200890 /ORGANISM="Paramoeba atlantica, Strain 621/1 / CCAP 1560/9" /LENGTH=171 /DNA_ID=CAMNT_0047866417 /DNA_START=36 /DNA_END=551 /DNA_ORIENTATION=-